jgi:choloylglycine hydrolase
MSIAMVALAAVLYGLVWVSTTAACTGIRLMARDGTIIYARTMECGQDLKSNMIVVPRGKQYVGTTPDGVPGLRWTTKYGFVGPNIYDQPYVCDGLNEKGLALGNFVFAGSAGYQKVEKEDAAHAIASYEVAVYLLGTCASVQEAIVALDGVRVCSVDMEPYNFLGPLHYILHDADGSCAVIEYVDGQMIVHPNPLGVITNSPTFDWHLTNLRNYIHLNSENAPPAVLSGQTFAPFGQGTGMLGLPGDFTPPSRFIRAVVFTQVALPTDTAGQCLQQAFHLLDQFDIPLGAARENRNGKLYSDFTNWTTAADMKHLSYYFHTFQNRRIKQIDLGKLDLDAKDIKTISMQGEGPIEDVSAEAK